MVHQEQRAGVAGDGWQGSESDAAENTNSLEHDICPESKPGSLQAQIVPAGQREQREQYALNGVTDDQHQADSKKTSTTA